jgi:hypothetical protein
MEDSQCIIKDGLHPEEAQELSRWVRDNEQYRCATLGGAEIILLSAPSLA